MDAHESRTMSRATMPRALAWILPPVLGIVAALISSTRGGNIISNGVVMPMPWSARFIDSLYEFSWWVILAPLIFVAVRRISTTPTNLPLRAAAHVLSGIVFCLLYFVLASRVHIPGDTLRLERGMIGIRSVLPVSVGMYLLVAAAAGLFVAIGRARDREREAAELALRTSRLETQLVEAQLGVLRAQLHPHFLFNSLHAISTLVDFRPKQARRMLTQLSELLRMALEFSEQREITLARELEWLERYIELQQVRFEERLDVDIRVSDDSARALVPPLLLQPLVENAIKYGIESRPEGGKVEVIAEHEGKWLRLRVRDDGPGMGATVSAGSGVGLRNTGARLRALYGDDQQVVLRPRDTGGVEALAELPFREAAQASGQATRERAG